MAAGLSVIAVGVWIITQVTIGQALERLKVGQSLGVA